MEQISLFPLEEKITRAIEYIKMFERTALQMDQGGYYLAFSGGKDSQVIYELAKMAGVKFKAHYHFTTIDPPELVRFIRKEYPNVVLERPEMSIWKLIVKKGFPPTRKVRYCCSELKERGGEGKFVITGVRWAESKKRSKRGLAELTGSKQAKVVLLNNDNDEKRRLIENCEMKGKRVLNPIIDWTDEDVWNFIHQYIGTYCELYDEGFKRLGCIGCPLASVRQRERELARYPGYKAAYVKTFAQMLERRELEHKETDIWKTPEAVFDWWMYGTEKTEKQIEGQLTLDLLPEGRNRMVNQKMIAEIFTDFRNLYTGKNAMGIRPLCEKYEYHPMLVALLTNMEAAAKLQVPQAMKEVYEFYKEYRGKDLEDADWKAIVNRTKEMAKDRQDNAWYRGVILEVVNLLEDDDCERRRIAKEVEKEMEEAASELEAA